MVTRASASRDIFKDLRGSLFFGEPVPSSDVEALRIRMSKASGHEKFTLWRRLRSLGVMPDPAQASTVMGVIMELGTDDGATTLVFGFGDGSASLYLSSGGGNIGGQARPQINAAARELTSVAAAFVPSLPLSEQHPLPGPGHARFSILTPAGVHVAEEEQDKLARGDHPLSALFTAADAIITGFRTVSEPKANDEASYVNCLLTALAHGGAEAALLTKGQPLPNPATLTNDPKDLAWIARLAFPLDRLSVKKVMGIVLRSAGFRRLRPGNGERTLDAQVTTSEGRLEDAAFLVSRRKDQGQMRVNLRALRR